MTILYMAGVVDANSLRKSHQILLLVFFISVVLVVDASGTGFLLSYQAFHKAKDSINNTQWQFLGRDICELCPISWS